ncbi:MAG: riboflavin synthase [Erythrobacter sp.]
MFTGIVTAIGTITATEERGDRRVRITAPLDPETIAIGASIACSGVCLTVVDRGGTSNEDGAGAWFDVDVSHETIRRTSAHMWNEGAKLNIEPSLKMGDELGGHIVTGHIDATGEVRLYDRTGDSWRLAVRARPELAPFIAEKGSVTVDGVSLTVNDIRDQPDGSCDFLLNIIPHTAQMTTLGSLSTDDEVNLEIDVLARYLKRMQSLAERG